MFGPFSGKEPRSELRKVARQVEAAQRHLLLRVYWEHSVLRADTPGRALYARCSHWVERPRWPLAAASALRVELFSLARAPAWALARVATFAR